ncbi:hypothetical protein [Kingella denitrificans]
MKFKVQAAFAVLIPCWERQAAHEYGGERHFTLNFKAACTGAAWE